MTKNKPILMMGAAIFTAAVLVFSSTAAPAHAVNTYHLHSFTSGWHSCIHGFPSSLNSASANSDGDLSVSADTDSDNTIGQATAFAYKSRYFSAGTEVTMYFGGTVDAESNGGVSNIIAYFAKPGTIYYSSLTGCVGNGASVDGSIVNLASIDTGESVSGFQFDSTTFTVPTSGTYGIVVYVDANTHPNGDLSASLTNPYVYLVW